MKLFAKPDPKIPTTQAEVHAARYPANRYSPVLLKPAIQMSKPELSAARHWKLVPRAGTLGFDGTKLTPQQEKAECARPMTQ